MRLIYAAEASNPRSDILYPANSDGVRPPPLGEGAKVPQDATAMLGDDEELPYFQQELPNSTLVKDTGFRANVIV
jgi:hypothetical protein